MQPFEPKSGCNQSADNIAERVDPSVLSHIREPRAWVSVVACIVDHDGLAAEIGCKIARQAAWQGCCVVEHERGGMTFGEVERAARLEEMRDDFGPAPDVGKPADRPPGDEDPIERCRARHRRWRIIEICLDELSPRGQRKLGGKISRSFYSRTRKVEPHDLGTALRQYQAIAPEVALQVQDAQPTHVAELFLLNLMQLTASGSQR